MSTEDGYTHVPMQGGPGVYVTDPDAFAAICARNARLDQEDAARVDAQSTQDGEPA